MACPEKPVGAFTPARKTLASTSTSNVFQSFGLNAVEAGAGNIDTKAGAGPAARPPPGAPPARPAVGGGGGGWIRSIAPPERVSGSRLPMRPCASTVTAAGAGGPPASVV